MRRNAKLSKNAKAHLIELVITKYIYEMKKYNDSRVFFQRKISQAIRFVRCIIISLMSLISKVVLACILLLYLPGTSTP